MAPINELVSAAFREEAQGEEALLTVKEYAERERVSRRTVERWIKRGLVSAQRHGRRGHWRVRICRILPYRQAAPL